MTPVLHSPGSLLTPLALTRNASSSVRSVHHVKVTRAAGVGMAHQLRRSCLVGPGHEGCHLRNRRNSGQSRQSGQRLQTRQRLQARQVLEGSHRRRHSRHGRYAGQVVAFVLSTWALRISSRALPHAGVSARTLTVSARTLTVSARIPTATRTGATLSRDPSA